MATKPSSSIDFLIESHGDSPFRQERRDLTSSTTSNEYIDQATTLLGGQVLTALRKAPNESMTAYELVDDTNINIQTLHQVLDVLATKYGWLEIEKDDPKGNYTVRLSRFGKQNLERYLR